MESAFRRIFLTSFFSLFLLGPVWADTIFTPTPIRIPSNDLPEPLAQFRNQILAYAHAGAFAAPNGDAEAKAWLLSRVSPEFVCERDFGGMCSDGNFRNRVNSFLSMVASGEPLPASKIRAGEPASFSPGDLEELAIDVGLLEGLLMQDGGDYCTAELVARNGREKIVAIEQALMNDPASGVSDELSAAYRIIGVIGTWNARAAPDIGSEVVGHVSDEIVVRLDPYDVRPSIQSMADGSRYRWTRVGLPDGREAYIAVGDGSILESLAPRLCIGLYDGQAVITRYVGGGD